ncbi:MULTISPECIES: hypothetical protein [unclassified Streptomyces]|uniref:hypothetical protein n=1 Tax=unclassified Streptomyces TaxID=2593676 RepID=UPI0011AFEF70|nr:MULTISPECIES: hypothetical protein [unclassified Streptomyces]
MSTDSQEISALLKEARPGINAGTPSEWLRETGSYVGALVYRTLYWPEVVEVSGAYFVNLHGLGEQEIARRVRSMETTSRQDWESLVNSFNHFEMSDLFALRDTSVSESQQMQVSLAESLVALWKARLSQVASEKQFTVRLAPPEPELGVCLEVRGLA